MSLKRSFAQSILKPAVHIPLAIVMAGSAGLNIHSDAHDDLDPAPVSETVNLSKYKRTVSELQGIGAQYEKIKSETRYENHASFPSWKLKDKLQQKEDIRMRYIMKVNRLGLDVMVDSNLNEKTYRQIAEYLPYSEHSSETDYPIAAYAPQKHHAESLQECRVKYADDLIGTQDAIGAKIDDCLDARQNRSGFLHLLMVLVMIGGFFGITGIIRNSKTLKRWSDLPKPRKLRPN